ncbi:MAG: hypothetical protein OQK71_04150 [Desulfobacter sp.]|nr:hypothetical protein [uncultured Desulfobacter sp.]MCW8800098.1 hypothetical protein [Desulfobacter sp.]
MDQGIFILMVMELDVFIRAGTGACPYGYFDNSIYMVGHDPNSWVTSSVG